MTSEPEQVLRKSTSGSMRCTRTPSNIRTAAGGVGNPDPVTRCGAIDHLPECNDIVRHTIDDPVVVLRRRHPRQAAPLTVTI